MDGRSDEPQPVDSSPADDALQPTAETGAFTNAETITEQPDEDPPPNPESVTNPRLCLGVRRISVAGVAPSYQDDDEADIADLSGAPISPTSWSVGRFQEIKGIYHRNLCRYVDLVVGRHGTLTLVSEAYDRNVAHSFGEWWDAADAGEAVADPSCVRDWILQSCHALAYLNFKGILHGCLDLESLSLDDDNGIKICDWGWVEFRRRLGLNLIMPAEGRYMAPEVVALGPPATSTPKADTWSVGFMMLAALLRMLSVSGTVTLPSALEWLHDGSQSISSYMDTIQSVLNHVQETWKRRRGDEGADAIDDVVDVLRMAVEVDVRCRPTPAELLAECVNRGIGPEKHQVVTNGSSERWVPKPVLRCCCVASSRPTEDHDGDPLRSRSAAEVYHLWSLAGGALPNENPTSSFVRLSVGVVKAPQGADERSTTLPDNLATLIPLTHVRALAAAVEAAAPPPAQADGVVESLEDREHNFAYQLHRLVSFKRWLRQGDAAAERLVAEVRSDVPPLLRGQVWCALLNLTVPEARRQYEDAQQIPRGDQYWQTRNQIAVDVPRCHQYDPVLASPAGQARMIRILSTWMNARAADGCMYWQGIDSVCAPCVVLLFKEEALIYAAFDQLVRRHLWPMFQQTQRPLHRQMVEVERLLAYHDPELATWLYSIGCTSEVYAVGWLRTRFAHTLSLTDVMRMWDRLLISKPEYILYICVAVIRVFRSSLFDLDLSGAAMMLSNPPPLVMSTVLHDADVLLHSTAYTPQMDEDWELSKRSVAVMLVPDLVRSLGPDTPWDRPLVVDIRSPKLFSAAHIRQCIHMPPSCWDGAEEALQPHIGRDIVVVDESVGDATLDFAMALIAGGYARVSILDGGVASVRRDAISLLVRSRIA